MNAPLAEPLAEPRAVRPDPADLLVWLAGLFAVAPTPEMVAAARSPAAAALLTALADDPDLDPDLGAGARTLAAALADPADPAALAARLSRSFGLLYLGIGGPSTVSPYESVWRTGRLMQGATAEMEALLARHGLSAAASGEAADHVSVELMLIAHLAAADHPDAIDLRRRLAEWVPDFVAATIQRDATGYFAGAALMLRGLVGHAPTGPDNPAHV